MAIKQLQRDIEQLKDHIEETNKSKKIIAVSDLVMLIDKKRDAEKAGDIEQVEKHNKEYPLLLVTELKKNRDKDSMAR